MLCFVGGTTLNTRVIGCNLFFWRCCCGCEFVRTLNSPVLLVEEQDSCRATIKPDTYIILEVFPMNEKSSIKTDKTELFRFLTDKEEATAHTESNEMEDYVYRTFRQPYI